MGAPIERAVDNPVSQGSSLIKRPKVRRFFGVDMARHNASGWKDRVIIIWLGAG